MRALERFGKYSSDTKAIEIIANSNHEELVNEAKERFPEGRTIDKNQINDIESAEHSAYCLCTLIESSVDESHVAGETTVFCQQKELLRL